MLGLLATTEPIIPSALKDDYHRKEHMYTDIDFKSKAAAKRAIADGTEFGCFPPGLGEVPENGTCSIEGPHYPKPHSWYGTATLKDGVVIKIT